MSKKIFKIFRDDRKNTIQEVIDKNRDSKTEATRGMEDALVFITNKNQENKKKRRL